MLILNPIAIGVAGILMLTLGTSPIVSFFGYVIVAGMVTMLIYNSLTSGGR